MVASNNAQPAAAASHTDTIAVIAAESSLLPNELHALGATIADAAGIDSANFLVVDGAQPSANAASVWPRVAARVRQGATCLILGANDDSLATLNTLLPRPVQLTDRRSTSLLVTSPDPLTAGMDNSDFYFTEMGDGPVIRHGLAGPLVTGGRTLLAACPTDWSRWNNRPEPIKTAATLRSEREAKPSGAALVEAKQGSGRYMLTTIDLGQASMPVAETVVRMMTNAGVRFQPTSSDDSAAFDTVGRLSRSLACGRFGGNDVAALYDTDNIGINAALKPITGAETAGRKWTVMTAAKNGVFDFHQPVLTGPEDNAAVYLSFWIWSPRPLDNLLVEPNMPRLDLLMGSDDGCQVWLNSRRIKEERGTHPLTPDSIVAEALPLQRNWNHFIVKVVQGGGEWSYAARLRCSDARFLLSLRSSVTSPDEKGSAQ